MKTTTGNLLEKLEILWKNVRIFAYRNRSIFELIFIFIYAFEQMIMIILIFYYPSYAGLVLSNYSIALLTTFAVHKLIMDSRIKILEEKITNLGLKYSSLEDEKELLMDKIENLKISKVLNMSKLK